MGYGWFPNTDYKDLPEEGIEPLKEHALNFYLPFDGGVEFGARGMDNKKDPRYKLYAVEFQPDCTSREAPVKLNSFNEIEKYNQENGYSWEDRNSLIKWGLERGFIFYGHEIWDESLFTYEEVVNIRMTQPNKIGLLTDLSKQKVFLRLESQNKNQQKEGEVGNTKIFYLRKI